VRELAAEAQKNDPCIVERASEFYAQHPQLVQGLGAAALALIMEVMENSWISARISRWQREQRVLFE